MDDDLRKAAQDALDAMENAVMLDEQEFRKTSRLLLKQYAKALRAALANNANAAPEAWVSVKNAMPQPGVTVLAYYKNRNGFERRIRAEWTAAKTEEANAEYDWGEYDEATDSYWTPEGWYECIDNWDEFSAFMVSEGEITHWMPLPPAPDPRQSAIEQVSRGCQWQAAMEDKRDAERYRWLRDNEDFGFTDSSVDYAMQQEQKP